MDNDRPERARISSCINWNTCKESAVIFPFGATQIFRQGVLSIRGKGFWYYSVAPNELMKLNVTDTDGNPIDEKWISEQKRILRESIRKAG